MRIIAQCVTKLQPGYNVPGDVIGLRESVSGLMKRKGRNPERARCTAVSCTLRQSRIPRAERTVRKAGGTCEIVGKLSGRERKKIIIHNCKFRIFLDTLFLKAARQDYIEFTFEAYTPTRETSCSLTKRKSELRQGFLVQI